MIRILLSTVALGITLVGCGGVETKVHPAYAPIEPIDYADNREGTTPASLYNKRGGLSLFEDTRARSIGDIVSVVLQESTSAAKSADTDLSKGSDIGVDAPVLFGEPFNFGGGDSYDLSQSIASEYGFQGQGSSNQSNRLQCKWLRFCPTAIWLCRAKSGSSSIRAMSLFSFEALFVPKIFRPSTRFPLHWWPTPAFLMAAPALSKRRTPPAG